ncbi:carnitine O-palmitoyltransferase 2, mitochondrial [Octopus sinensis]|uniref:Carnitine O-palmitoyltransferase 2, mitochondrial n=1 Tax=Octopus sinensis TaxID=2607531 RepID=A0A6P7S780_9MOLL|nr:carnitine O-palmitoyltransferase 2, mitochondrial [Octopus sinensis]
MSRMFRNSLPLFSSVKQRNLLFATLQRGRASSSEFLKKSKVPTYHFQKSLPRLPIPKLEDTCRNYLLTQKALLNETQYQSTEKIVKEFEQNEGKTLHDELVALDKANKHTSYISAPWFDMYLKDRRPVVLNHTPFTTVIDDPRPEYNTQLIRATNIIFSSLRFMKSLEEETLEPEVFHLNPKKSDTEMFRKVVRWLPEAVSWYGAFMYKAYPLDMSQYKRLFKSTRIPKKSRDELHSNPSSRHLLVLHKGHLYSFDVLNSDGSIKPAEEILAHLKYICNNPRPVADYPVAQMTTENRDVWADVRQHFIETGNEEILREVDGALFALSLDHHSPSTSDEILETYLHGDGSNRWFDKSINPVVSSDGRAAVTFEHSWGDGVAVLRYINDVMKDTIDRPVVGPDTMPSSATDSSKLVKHLDFQLDAKLKAKITNAKEQFQEAHRRLQKNVIDYKKFNKSFIKSKNLSPDSVMQLVIQMAFYKMTSGEFAASYESCSTAAFKHGRTETIRPNTLATKKACEMIFGPKSTATLAEMQAVLDECSKVHMNLTKSAAMGKGFDRHLFGMRTLAEKANAQTPALFADPNYKHINHIVLSTSTLSSPMIQFGGFGPVVPNGFGIGYQIGDEATGYIVTSYNPHRSGSDFVVALEESLNAIYNILEGRSPH